MENTLDVAWITLCGILVFIMQAGFLCLEAGATRSKNRINVVLKNLADLGISVMIFWAIGYGLMFGSSWHGLMGTSDFSLNLTQDRGDWTGNFFLFQAMFCSTAVTILSGAAAERIRFKIYLVITVLISGVVYPIFGHWVWHGAHQGDPSGWLAQRGFVDFAGSTVVHSLGGWCALATVLVLGPRIGRFTAKRQFEESESADLPLAATGTMLLWFGWFGFNGGSNLSFGPEVSTVIVNTLIGGAAGLVTPIIIMELRGQPIKSQPILNGTLAGLVAVTSGCYAFSTAMALLVGAVGSVMMMVASHWLKRWKIDDVVDAIPVHLVSGIWGTLAVGFFADLTLLGTGLNRVEQIKAQATGVIACGLWAFSITLFGLLALRYWSGLRVSARQEYVGLNISEHGAKSDVQDVYSVMRHHAETGQLNRRIQCEPFTEIGRVGHWYNQVIASLEKALAMNHAIIHTATDGIVTVEPKNLSIQSANPSLGELFGYECDRLIDQPIQQILTSSVSEPVLRQLANATSPQSLTGLRRDGTTFPVEATATLTDVRGNRIFTLFLKDISARTQAENELIGSRSEARAKAKALEAAMRQLKQTAQVINHERIAGQNQLVAGIAHEINNPVGFIHSNLQHAENYVAELIFALEQYQQRRDELSEASRSQLDEQLEDTDISYIVTDFSKLMDSMRTGTKRIRTIVKQLKAFAHHDEADLKSIDVPTSIDSILAMLSHRLKATNQRPKIVVQQKYKDLPQVECYASSINRAIFNILSNAIDAIDRTAATGIDTPSRQRPTINIYAQAHTHSVILTLANNGPAIEPETRQRMFDPFFTTQPIGKGTGLGCTLSYQIVVEQHRGRLEVHSKHNHDTCFVIELPLTQTHFEVPSEAPSEPQPEDNHPLASAMA